MLVTLVRQGRVIDVAINLIGPLLGFGRFILAIVFRRRFGQSSRKITDRDRFVSRRATMHATAIWCVGTNESYIILMKMDLLILIVWCKKNCGMYY